MNPFRHSSPEFPYHKDLETSDLPSHLQQTLPQYRLSGIPLTTKEPSKFQVRQQNNPEYSLNYRGGTGNIPQPFRPNSKFIAPSTHRPNYSHLFSQTSHHHDPSKPETFLGEITIQSPAELPPQFNSRIPSFQPSVGFPHSKTYNTIQQRSPTEPLSKWRDENTKNKLNEPEVRQEDYKPRVKGSLNAVVLGTGSRASFLNQRTRIVAPESDSKDKLEIKNYYVDDNGDVYSSTKLPSTTIRPTTFSYKYNFDSSPSKAITFNNVPFAKAEEPSKTFDLDSLLEEPIGERGHSKDNDEVEIIQEATVPPDQFYTLPPETKTYPITEENDKYDNSSNDEIAEYDYEIANDEDEKSTSTKDKEGNYYLSNDQNEVEQNETDTFGGTTEEANIKIKNASRANDISLRRNNNIEINTRNTSFEIVTLKSTTKMVKDDNFGKFVDTGVIDMEEEDATTTIYDDITNESESEKDGDLKEAVVSVVTTKSVINNTFIPTVTENPIFTEQMSSPIPEDENTTDTWIVVASVQTSRSVSGARYLPSSVVKQNERTKLLIEDSEEKIESDNDNIEMERKTTRDPSDISLETSSEKPFSQERVTEEENNPSQLPDKSKTSTESLIDKLDRVQSDLSSSLLAGGFNNGGNNITVIKEPVSEKINDNMMNIIVTSSTTTNKPLIVIRKFSPHLRPSTTIKPKKIINIANIKQDDLTGLLPPGYKAKYQNPRTSSEPSLDINLPQNDQPIQPKNFSYGRSSGLLNKNKVQFEDIPHYKKPSNGSKEKTLEEILGKIIVLDDPALLPSDYKSKLNNSSETNKTKSLKITKIDDLSGLLPPGYKSPASAPNKNNETKSLKVTKVDDISAFLPPGYKPNKVIENNSNGSSSNKTDKPKKINILDLATPVSDISALLPPGYKAPKEEMNKTAKELNDSSKSKDLTKLLSMAKPVDDISSLLPPGYRGKFVPNKPSTTTTSSTKTTEKEVDLSTTEKPQSGSGFKVVFPSRPGIGNKASNKRLTTPKTINSNAPIITLPSIQKGWPTR